MIIFGVTTNVVLNERLFEKKGEPYNQYTGKFNEEYHIKSTKKSIMKKQSFTPEMEIYHDRRGNYSNKKKDNSQISMINIGNIYVTGLIK